MVVVIAAVASEADLIFDNIGAVAVAALMLNVAAMAIGFGISRLARLNTRQATAIAMELGVHNSTVAIAVAALIDTEIAIPAAVYSMFMFVTAGTFARFIAGRNAPAHGDGCPLTPPVAVDQTRPLRMRATA